MRSIPRILRSAAEAILPQQIFMELLVRRRLRAGFDPDTVLLPFLTRGGIFVDVGANVGNWSVPAARLFREVHAFEPDRAHATGLSRVVPGNVFVHRVALSDHNGYGQLVIPIWNGEEWIAQASLEVGANADFEHTITRQVPVTTLDSFGLRDIDVIKIDVEGHEAFTLAGAAISIDRNRPTLIVEIEERHHPAKSEKIISSIISRGYECCFLYCGQLQRFVAGTIEQLQPKEGQGGTGFKSQDYINNFVFIPNEYQEKIEDINNNLNAGRADRNKSI